MLNTSLINTYPGNTSHNRPTTAQHASLQFGMALASQDEIIAFLRTQPAAVQALVGAQLTAAFAGKSPEMAVLEPIVDRLPGERQADARAALEAADTDEDRIAILRHAVPDLPERIRNTVNMQLAHAKGEGQEAALTAILDPFVNQASFDQAVAIVAPPNTRTQHHLWFA